MTTQLRCNEVLVASRKDRGIGFGGNLGADKIGIEPTLLVAQKKRYLDFLNQLRRENEGDDTADSPGYSLNLVRVPVSVLPGKKTDEGHGAEVTMTLTPVLGDDLLPQTFRDLVANDLLHQLGFPLTQFLDAKEPDGKQRTADRVLTADVRDALTALPAFNDINRIIREFCEQEEKTKLREYLATLPDDDIRRLRTLAKLLDEPQGRRFEKLLKPADKTVTVTLTALDGGTKKRVERAIDEPAAEEYGKNLRSGPDPALPVQREAGAFNLRLSIPPLSYSPGLLNKTGFPTSQLLDVYGLNNCFQIAYAANTAFTPAIERQKYAHLPDIQGFLQQEILAAYRFLAEADSQPLWQQFCTPDLVTAVRSRRLDTLQTLRESYRKTVEGLTQSTKEFRDKRPYNEPGQFSTTAALAWCILVDSALLTDKLVRDMKETATAKGAALPHCGVWLPYYLPDPPPDARTAFNGYVKVRWPVHVFALDPYTQDQNVADQLSTRRETQLALAIAFTNGFIGANTLTKFTRRLEAEYETIALNRTQVGFGHGENVFGWRFYPRFQTPDTEGNLTVLFRDNLLGGPNRNALLRQRRLEPGPRECVAVVLMPSFVPYATLDTTTNWFALANPKHKTLDHTQALKMSRVVQGIKTLGCGATDAACYRNGEHERLLRRAEQLEARLPAQTLTFPVPVLNTLGGFEMFSNGTTDLAPELYGWYGAPGVSKEASTALFLVGDHFSPLRTTVIVGNQAVATKMLSRQEAQITIPEAAAKAMVLVTDKDGKKYAQAHIATPYGVTRELLIPVVGAAPAAPDPKPGFTVGDVKLTITHALKPNDPHPAVPVAVGVENTALKLKWFDPLGVAPQTVRVELVFDVGGTEVTVPCICGALATANNLGEVVIGTDELKRVAAHLFSQDGVRKLATAGGLAAGLTTKKVLVTPDADKVLPGGQVARRVPANDQLKVEFKAVGWCGVELKPDDAGCHPPVIQPTPVPVPPGLPLPLGSVPGKAVVPVPPGVIVPVNPGQPAPDTKGKK